jgi:hypothetical protein
MMRYPTIPKEMPSGPTVWWVFDKLDGSNIRAQWSFKKKSWSKVGSRTQLLAGDSALGPHIPEIKMRLEELSPAWSLAIDSHLGSRGLLGGKRKPTVTAFFEYHGPQSFAGGHVLVEPHRLTLLDVHVTGVGFISPKDLLLGFSAVSQPRLLHTGLWTVRMSEMVISGKFPGMTLEGVVGKSGPQNQDLCAWKLKSHVWLTRLVERHPDTWAKRV